MGEIKTSGIDFYAGVYQLVDSLLAKQKACGFEPRHPLKALLDSLDIVLGEHINL